jgi:GxxExxY protein
LLFLAQLTGQILRCAYRVHSRLGPGLLERPYRLCLAYELRRADLQVESEKLLPVVYDGIAIDSGYRLDLLIEGSVVVEVKAVDSLLPIHDAQLLAYLKLSGVKIGFLINFNVPHLRDGVHRRVMG